MLWQQIRHSKEQQTFSTSSNRATLSAATPAVWRYCSQAAAPTIRFIYTVHRHTHTQECAHAKRNPARACAHNRQIQTLLHTLVPYSGESLSTLSDIWQGSCLVKTGSTNPAWCVRSACVVTFVYVCVVRECVGG